MTMPLHGQLHRDKALENISIAYKPAGLIADELAPKVFVQNESDVYYVYSRDTMAVPETARANGTKSNRATWNMSTSAYHLEDHALNDVITERDRKNADSAIKLDSDVTEILTGKIALRRELDLASIVGTAGNWANATSLSSTQAWNQNTTLSNPVTLLDSAGSVVIQSSGLVPNVLAINEPTFRALKNHTSITGRIQYTSADSITEAMLGKLFAIDKVIVGRASYNTADEGLTDSMSFIWTDCALLAYVEKSPSLKKASALYTFWQNGAGSPMVVKKWADESIGGDVVEVSTMFQHKPVATACAYHINNTIS